MAAPDTADWPIVVLGCRVRRGIPGPTLTRRLEVALRLYRPGRRIVVTGQDEAPAMARWLVEHGVARDDIVVEPRATSTNENLENTREIFHSATGWVVVTSSFHAPRVKLWAWHHRYPVEVVTSATPSRAWDLYVREGLALIHSAARVLWRRLH